MDESAALIERACMTSVLTYFVRFMAASKVLGEETIAGSSTHGNQEQRRSESSEP
jgi:hypothetical protein